MMTDDGASNIWDTARFLKLSADMEHDDPEQAPEMRVYHSKGPPLAEVMEELRQTSPYAHGATSLTRRYCACCNKWRADPHKNGFCPECLAPWERES